MRFACFSLLLFLQSCSAMSMATAPSNPQNQTDPDRVYKMDLELTVNGISGNGMMVVPNATVYEIEARAPGSVEILTMQTCHREIVMNRSGERVRLRLEPTEIERSGYCPVTISAFSPKFRYAGGFIDPQASDASLTASLICNGAASASAGVSVCQSRTGLAQKIVFESEVQVGPSKCGAPKDLGDKKSFELRLSTGMCVYAFKEINGSRIHRLTTNGYEEFNMSR